jgi:hypothetical protein
MKARIFAAFVLLTLTVSGAETPRLIAIDPNGVSPAMRNEVIACNEDIDAILSGKPPAHAAMVELILDGGTHRYQGHGYSIMVYKSWCRIAGIAGTLVGPVVHFEKPLAIEDDLTVSLVRFEPDPSLEKVLPNKSPEATTLARTPAADAPVAPAIGRASS